MLPLRAGSLSAPPADHLCAAVAAAGGWLPFERFMQAALYAPGLGYYARGAGVFGHLPAGGSDFVTAPEMTPLFGRTLARQVAQALAAADADEITEFGAGSGALAEQLLGALGERVRYSIVDVSGSLRQQQAERLAAFGNRVRWLEAWPEAIDGVVVGNEVLDAMPVTLLAWDGTAWHERGVVLHEGAFAWQDRPTGLRPPVATDGLPPGYVTEIHPQALAFVRTLAGRLRRGVALFIDYGFPEAEYYHPDRSGGTLMCHRGHTADTDPLADAGSKDITAHVDFSAIALAGQDAGLDVLGYTTQAHFLLNCGLLDQVKSNDHRAKAAVQKLLGEHEMGELFKVLAFGRGVAFEPMGFTRGDRSHTL